MVRCITVAVGRGLSNQPWWRLGTHERREFRAFSWRRTSLTETPDAPTIRRAKPEEAGEVTAIAMRSKAYWGYDDRFMETFRPELIVTAEQIAQEYVVVIERDGRIAGFAHLRPESDDTLELVSLFIDTWAIRQGFGQRIWDYVIAYARDRGYQAMTLEADPNAEPFYRKQGAVMTGTRESTLMPGRALNLMTITVAEQP